MLRFVLLGALALGAGGCGSGGGGSGGSGQIAGGLSCEWLEGPQNCWQAAVDDAYAECAVADADEGYFGGDYLSCSYPNGDSDVYGSAGRALDGGGNGHDDFYVEATRSGSMCFTFEAPPPSAGAPSDTPRVMSLTTRSGRVVVTTSATNMAIQCPDGRTFAANGADMLLLLGCPMREYPDGSSMVPLPGHVYSMASFTLLPPATSPAPGPLTNCTCAPQPPPEDGGIPPPEPACPN